MAKRKNGPMTPYAVQLRDYERQLLRGALEAAGGELEQAAIFLGVTTGYIKARVRLLGGVRPGEPKHEPPGPAAKAWNATALSGRVRGRQKQDRKLNAPEETPNEETTNTDNEPTSFARSTEAEPANETADA